MASNSKNMISSHKFLALSLIIISFSGLLLVFFLRPRSAATLLANTQWPQTDNPQGRPNPRWFNHLPEEIKGHKKIKVGLVNFDDGDEGLHGMHETVHVGFARVSSDLTWKDFFPGWTDQSGDCPEIPMPRLEEYRDLDVVVAKVPCEWWNETKGMRDVWMLQVNLVVANMLVAGGWANQDVGRRMYAVMVGEGECGPMEELFRCDDLVKHEGNYWVYEPELGRLKQKVLMPNGACQIARGYAETGQEIWREFPSQLQLNRTAYRQRKAYVTILHSSKEYVCGAIALAHSIRRTGSYEDLILLYDGSIPRDSLEGLRAAGWETRPIHRIRSPFSQKGTYNEWNYSKLRIWQLTDYHKVIFIDADFLVLQNIDGFFYYPQLSAAPNNKMLFNSGIMMVEPSTCLFERLIRKSFVLPSYNGGDQGFLNEVFTWWHRWPSKINHLKNFDHGESEEERVIPDDVYAVHYLGWKPWMCYRDYDCNWDNADRRVFASDEANRLWWEMYDEMPERLQEYCAMTKSMDARIKKWRAIAQNANYSDGHWAIELKDPRQR